MWGYIDLLLYVLQLIPYFAALGNEVVVWIDHEECGHLLSISRFHVSTISTVVDALGLAAPRHDLTCIRLSNSDGLKRKDRCRQKCRITSDISRQFVILMLSGRVFARYNRRTLRLAGSPWLLLRVFSFSA